jgi:DNA polymerase
MDKLKELEEVYKEIVKNQFKSDSPVVFGEGKRNPYIMLIGEAPGQKEEELGKPFVGAAGKNLDEFLEVLEIKREDIYITNVVKIRPFKVNPSTGRKSNRTPTKGEVKSSVGVLFQQIDEINPSIVVTLGNTPLRAIEVKDDIKIGDFHGKPIKKEGYTLFPLYHPASIIYNRKLYDTYIEDLHKLKKLLSRGKMEE